DPRVAAASEWVWARQRRPDRGRSRPRPDPAGWVFWPIAHSRVVLRHLCSAFLEGVPLTAPTPRTNRGVGTFRLAEDSFRPLVLTQELIAMLHETGRKGSVRRLWRPHIRSEGMEHGRCSGGLPAFVKGLVFGLGKLHTFVAETNQFVAAKRAQVAFFVKKTRFKMLNHPLRKPCLRVVFRAFKLAQESGKSAFGSRVEALGVGHVNDLKA